jgi:hypothetical protein
MPTNPGLYRSMSKGLPCPRASNGAVCARQKKLIQFNVNAFSQ